MTRKQIDQSREIRLWIGQVIVPVTALVMAVSPEARAAVTNKVKSVKDKIQKKLKREGP